MMRFLLLFFLLVVCLENAFASWVDDHLMPHVAFDCAAYIGDLQLYSSVVRDSALYNWLESEMHPTCIGGLRGYISYEESVSVQDACMLLQADVSGAVSIYNSLIEFSRDPLYKGEVCSWSGLVN